jgi:GTP1/Obg family GTP-binding protein
MKLINLVDGRKSAADSFNETLTKIVTIPSATQQLLEEKTRQLKAEQDSTNARLLNIEQMLGRLVHLLEPQAQGQGLSLPSFAPNGSM